MKMNNTIATMTWQKYTGNLTDPQLGEQCLWSIKIFEFEEREYFVGYLSSCNEQLYIRWHDGLSFKINDSLYYARINKMAFDENE
jgi:hypothetical protein